MTKTDINARSTLANPDDQPIAYMQRVRAYYLALGYNNPYQWAHYSEVPFAPLRQPLSESRVALVTTAAPYNANAGDQGPGAAYNGAAKFFATYEFDINSSPDLLISHIAYDRQHNEAQDNNTWLPIEQLKLAHDEGLIKLSQLGFGLPTNRSQRVTIEKDCPDLLYRVQQASVDAVVFVPNCPVCHQSVSLAARHLEASGIPTVIMGCAKDIVEFVGVPRFLFSDFPLGHSAGKPDNPVSQRQTLRMALDLLSTASCARTTVQSPQRFSDSCEWKLDYSNPDRLSEHELAQRRREFDKQKQLTAKLHD